MQRVNTTPMYVKVYMLFVALIQFMSEINSILFDLPNLDGLCCVVLSIMLCMGH